MQKNNQRELERSDTVESFGAHLAKAIGLVLGRDTAGLTHVYYPGRDTVALKDDRDVVREEDLEGRAPGEWVLFISEAVDDREWDDLTWRGTQYRRMVTDE